jgi:hypothetical protein
LLENGVRFFVREWRWAALLSPKEIPDTLFHSGETLSMFVGDRMSWFVPGAGILETWQGLVIVAGAAGFLLAAAVACIRPLRRLYREVEIEKARELFALQRERLEAKFVDLAAATGKPKGLAWENCDFHSLVCFARDRSSGQLSAFVEVTISFSAIEGGGMEQVEAVSDKRRATAVFHYQHGQWGTSGRALFNMTPKEAIRHFQAQYEPVPVVPT